MSSATPETSVVKTAEPEPSLRVVGHTGLLYWWPVWLVGFILAGLTYLDGDRMAIVPGGTQVRAAGDRVYEFTVPNQPSQSLVEAEKATAEGQNVFPVRASGNRDYGMVYVMVLLLVVFGSNVPLRGLWSVVAVLLLIVLTVVLAYFDVWGWLLDHLWKLHIEITLAGYLVTSVGLLVLWVATVFGFDQLHYLRFTPGQFIYHQGIGDAREVYDTTRVTVSKRRSDLLRHYVLGLGAGDLVISVPNVGKEIVLQDVLFADSKVKQIANLMRTRLVTSG